MHSDFTFFFSSIDSQIKHIYIHAKYSLIITKKPNNNNTFSDYPGLVFSRFWLVGFGGCLFGGGIGVFEWQPFLMDTLTTTTHAGG